MKAHVIKIPIYHCYLCLQITADAGNNCSGYVKRDKKNNIYWIVFKKRSVSHGLVAHEVVHLVNMIFADRGIRLDVNNDEPQAYLTEYITKKIYKAIKSLEMSSPND